MKNSKVYRKKSDKSEKKKIYDIARKILDKRVEVKKYHVSATGSVVTAKDTLRAFNINFAQVQGATDSSVIGTRIFVKHFTVNMQFVRDGNANIAGSYNEIVPCRMMIIRTKKLLTTTDSAITNNDVLVGSTRIELAYPDYDKVDVLYDHVFDLTNKSAVSRTVASASNQTILSRKILVNRNIQFDSDAGSLSGILKDKNYYVVYGYGSSNILNYVTANIFVEMFYTDQ